MKSLELPLRRRTLSYRLFEMLPGVLSWGALVLLILLAVFQPGLAAIYLLLIFATVLVKAAGVAVHTLRGSSRVRLAQRIDWGSYVLDIDNLVKTGSMPKLGDNENYFSRYHMKTLERIQQKRAHLPLSTDLYNAVIIPMYNESYTVLDGTIRSLLEGATNPKQLIIVIAYEERGGADAKKVADQLKRAYRTQFYGFEIVQHPSDLKDEVVGKGANITFAGHYLRDWLESRSISYDRVIVTSLDSDNRPHEQYFNYVMYEYITHANRKHLSFQPVSLFLNNIWDVPAPMRVIATGNSFWNLISVMRPHMLRNFASHSQPMDALVEMDFWSKRTIVEDGHQYWRSYFHFKGEYDIVPIFVPIYQDAVLSETYGKTLKAQFVQLRRWAYGASDIPYVAMHTFKNRTAPFFASFSRLIRLIDSHLTLACLPPLVAFGGWVPLFINSEAGRSVVVNQLPEVLGIIQRFAMAGLIVSVFVSFKMLPPRPERYKRHRTLGMLLQWVLMPVTSLIYSSFSAYYSQTRLLVGNYMTKFEVTEKASAVLENEADVSNKQA